MTALPTSAMLKQFSSAAGQHLFIVGGSRIYDIGDDTAKLLERALRLDGVERIPIEIAALLDRNNAHPPMAPAKPPKITALSLNIAQSCNNRCSIAPCCMIPCAMRRRRRGKAAIAAPSR
jgi:uncharacterized protein